MLIASAIAIEPASVIAACAGGDQLPQTALAIAQTIAVALPKDCDESPAADLEEWVAALR